MRVWGADGAVSHCLDYALIEGSVRIRVHSMTRLGPVPGLYFQRAQSPWLIWNYVQEVGAKGVYDKIVSRLAESLRNEKYLSVGAGTVEATHCDGFEAGQAVTFVAPAHPSGADRLVLDGRLVTPSGGDGTDGQSVQLRRSTGPIPESVQALAGWMPESQVPLPRIDWDLVRTLASATSDPSSTHPGAGSAATEIDRAPPGEGLGATLFGYGNYAKSAILPSLPAGVRVNRIHEIDPLQIPAKREGRTWDTSPTLRPQDDNPVVFLAGHHHTHAPLAADALARDRVVVVEKPLVVDEDQLKRLEAAYAAASTPRYFACFHKRYSPLNELARRDLGTAPGDPVSYHCIVYEVPLPERHWYRWPASGSRITSNGCHWLDHFLFMNDWCEFSDVAVHVGADGAVNVSVSLENGAFGTMLLTDVGSPRIGVQEHVELRAGGRTVRIANSSRYAAESDVRVLRRRRVSKMTGYRGMYEQIGLAILDGGGGDSWRSIDVSSRLMLAAEAELRRISGDG